MPRSAPDHSGIVAPRQLIAEAQARLLSAGIDTARLDAEVMLAHAAGSTRVEVAAGSARISNDAARRFAAMVERRLAREPVAYIVGHKEFFSLDFEITPAVLIPRPETEVVVARALECLSRRRGATRVLDLGTGSGAIAIAIAASAPDSIVTATDISADALAVARLNADRLLSGQRFRLLRADFFEPLEPGCLLGRFDLIVSNPPYVDVREIEKLDPEVRNFEPRVALVNNSGGALESYRRIAHAAPRHLESGGEIVVEVGAEQAAQIAGIFADSGLRVTDVIKDLTGIPRALVAARPD